MFAVEKVRKHKQKENNIVITREKSSFIKYDINFNLYHRYILRDEF